MQLKIRGLVLSAVAIATMGATTVACTPRTEKPSDVPAEFPAPNVHPSPTEKGLRTNVTRPPMSVAPNVQGGNPAVPCGFGPAGGLPCQNW